MNRSEEDIRRIGAWRRDQSLTVDRDQRRTSKFTVEAPEQPNFHFFSLDSANKDRGMADVSLHRDDKADRAVFSIPVKFTEENRTKYRQHDRTDFAFDLRVMLQPQTNKSPALSKVTK